MVIRMGIMVVCIVGRRSRVVILRMTGAPRAVIIITVHGVSVLMAAMIIASRPVPVRLLRPFTMVVVVSLHARG